MIIIRKRLSPGAAVFILLSALSISNLFEWPANVDLYRDFGSHVLANSVLNAAMNKNMDISIVPGYVFITLSVNYAASLLIRKWSILRAAAFISVVFVASAAISVASASNYLTS